MEGRADIPLGHGDKRFGRIEIDIASYLQHSQDRNINPLHQAAILFEIAVAPVPLLTPDPPSPDDRCPVGVSVIRVSHHS